MYVPDGAKYSNEELVEMKKKKPRKIVHDNTRFQNNPWNRSKSREMMKQAASAKALANCGKIGHDGKEILPSESPQVNGYGFMGTPSPAPGVDESPLMTWGEIESTPFRLDPSDALHTTPGPTFKVCYLGTCITNNRVRVMVFNATFSDISVILWRSVLLVEETRVPRENDQPVTSH